MIENKNMEKHFQDIEKAIGSHQKFVITTHRNPDGDAIGSSLSMGILLEALGKEVRIVFPNPVAKEFESFPYMEKVIYADSSEALCVYALHWAEILVCLDFNTLSRTGSFLSLALAEAAVLKLLIDHHENPDSLFDIVYSDPSKSSTAEMVYEVISALYRQKLELRDLIFCIYTGIVTDTGCFRFATSARTHAIVSDLMNLGLDPDRVYHQIYHQNSLRRIQLQAYLLQTQLTYLPKYNTSYILLSSQTLKKFSCQRGDYEGVVNVPLTIKNAKLSLLFVEDKEGKKVKISLRSRGAFSVCSFAAQHFGGGGHKNAAGATLSGSLQEATSKFVDLLSSYDDLLK